MTKESTERFADEVVGSFILHYKDVLRMRASRLPRNVRGFCIIVGTLSAALLITRLSEAKQSLNLYYLSRILTTFLEDMWPIWLILFVFIFLLIFVCDAIDFLKMSIPSRTVDYIVSNKQITIRDKSGFALVIPWSSIRSFRNTKYSLEYKLGPRARRSLIWRAFTLDDRERIVTIAQQSAGVSEIGP